MIKKTKHIADVKQSNYYFVENGRLYAANLCGVHKRWFGDVDTLHEVTDFDKMSDTKIALLKKTLGNFKTTE